ncbi:MAG: hypothetical protein Q8K93_00895 [Reyranella sp.]|uniref:hypothetical protein n=1 Tax=Reyranella sp. TaxID=1929291 RepID=UPI002730ECB5|nr:hypothetical protein [Reyranella sp.]MDP1960733.1 hypothetical protein [Reyranella sp.]MDP2375382.1 hypothetical protein [Reyranella sp.]
MDRGLKAPLSANEDVTLRRVAYGIAQPNELIARDVEHLTRLALIDRQGGRLVLTDLGRQRLAATPGPHFRGPPSNDQGVAQVLGALIKKSPG